MSRQRGEEELDRLAERTEGDLDRFADNARRAEAVPVKCRPPMGSGRRRPPASGCLLTCAASSVTAPAPKA